MDSRTAADGESRFCTEYDYEQDEEDFQNFPLGEYQNLEFLITNLETLDHLSRE
jgi:hypothetical protein